MQCITYSMMGAIQIEYLVDKSTRGIGCEWTKVEVTEYLCACTVCMALMTNSVAYEYCSVCVLMYVLTNTCGAERACSLLGSSDGLVLKNISFSSSYRLSNQVRMWFSRRLHTYIHTCTCIFTYIRTYMYILYIHTYIHTYKKRCIQNFEDT